MSSTPAPVPEPATPRPVAPGDIANLAKVIGKPEKALARLLGPRVQRTYSFAIYQPRGSSKVMLRMESNKVVGFTAFLAQGVRDPQQALFIAGFELGSLPPRREEKAVWWLGSDLGVDVAQVGVILEGSGEGNGWDCIQAIPVDSEANQVAALIAARQLWMLQGAPTPSPEPYFLPPTGYRYTSSARRAEDGSPRTVHVSEYTRKDGTRVRAHERRAPRRGRR